MIGMIATQTKRHSRGTPKPNPERQAAIEQAKHVDMVQLASRYIELRRHAAGGELEGPCPKCGGKDRFIVDPHGWFCRQCKPFDKDHGWYGPVDFVMWMHGFGFLEAVAYLTGAQMTTPTITRTQATVTTPAVEPQPQDWRDKAGREADAAHLRLMAGEEGEAHRAYLTQRGLLPATWAAFGVGAGEGWYTLTNHPEPAIVMPWRRGGQVVALRYRFIDPPLVQKPDELVFNKMLSKSGSRFGGLLFGGQALLGAGERQRTLVICEGEMNAMSIWQVGHDAGVDVLSIGSESSTITDPMIQYAAQYRHRIVWMDKQEQAKRVGDAFGAQVAARSPTIGEREYDANALLITGRLGAFLATLRARACVTEDDKRKLLYDLCDASTFTGLDQATAAVALQIAERLGVATTLAPCADGLWRAG
jgi:hypothetical protein